MHTTRRVHNDHYLSLSPLLSLSLSTNTNQRQKKKKKMKKESHNTRV